MPAGQLCVTCRAGPGGCELYCILYMLMAGLAVIERGNKGIIAPGARHQCQPGRPISDIFPQ